MDLETGQQELELRGHGTSVQAVALSPDGSRLASVGSDGLVRARALGLDDLIAIAERRLTRSFTDEECPAVPRSERVPDRLIPTATPLPHGCCGPATALLHRRVRRRLHTAARHEGAVMALTEERIEVQQSRDTTEATEPTSPPPEAHRGWSPVWLLILGGAVAQVMHYHRRPRLPGPTARPS